MSAAFGLGCHGGGVKGAFIEFQRRPMGFLVWAARLFLSSVTPAAGPFLPLVFLLTSVVSSAACGGSVCQGASAFQVVVPPAVRPSTWVREERRAWVR